MKNPTNRPFQRKILYLTLSIGIIYFYFGMLKFFPGLSPAEQIGSTTVCKLCLNLIPADACLILLALMEVAIGLCLITRKFLRPAILIALFHMVMTFLPFVLFPELIFQETLLSPSLLGQYIYKNIIIICALWVIYPPKFDDRKEVPIFINK